MYTKLEDIPLDIINNIDLDMTPEDAISVHLEWGALRDNNKYYNNSETDTYYFYVNSWHDIGLYLIHRVGFDFDILGTFEIPEEYIDNFWLNYKGIFGISDPLKEYITNKLKMR